MRNEKRYISGVWRNLERLADVYAFDLRLDELEPSLSFEPDV
jgi:hypothetical protein